MTKKFWAGNQLTPGHVVFAYSALGLFLGYLLGTHYRTGMSGITSDTIASIHSGQSAPKVGEMISVSIKPETLMLLPEEAGAV